MSEPEVIVHPTPDLVAKAVAARLVIRLLDSQAARGRASVVLTGGGLGIEVLRELRACPARDALEWSRMDVWWGDERFVPAANPERNELQARQALLDYVPVDRNRVFPFPASDGELGDNLQAAADAYAGQLNAMASAQGRDGVPMLDVLLLGVGEEGHVASIFPRSPAISDDRLVISVSDSPKKPRSRLSLSLSAINSADEVWLIVAGAHKAKVVAEALNSANPADVPAAGVHGRYRTLWLLDTAAAQLLPQAQGTAPDVH